MPSNTSPAMTAAPIAASPKWKRCWSEFPLVVAGGIWCRLMSANRSNDALGLAAARCAAIRSAGVGAESLGTRGALDVFAKLPMNAAAEPTTIIDLPGRRNTVGRARLRDAAWVKAVPRCVPAPPDNAAA